MRGKIFRDTNAGSGIVFVNNEQMTFTLEQHWKSPVPPAVNQTVDVSFNPAGEIVGLLLVDESTLAKEQAQQAAGAASEMAKNLGLTLVEKTGKTTLIATALLAFSWVFLNLVTIGLSSSYQEGATMLEMLRLVNGGHGLDGLAAFKNGSAGLYGLLMWAAIFAPLAPYFVRHRYGWVLNFAPLVFLSGAGLALYFTIKHQVQAASSVAGLFGDARAQQMAEKMMSEMLSAALKAVSMGAGFYVSLMIALYFAYTGLISFRK